MTQNLFKVIAVNKTVSTMAFFQYCCGCETVEEMLECAESTDLIWREDGKYAEETLTIDELQVLLNEDNITFVSYRETDQDVELYFNSKTFGNLMVVVLDLPQQFI